MEVSIPIPGTVLLNHDRNIYKIKIYTEFENDNQRSNCLHKDIFEIFRVLFMKTLDLPAKIETQNFSFICKLKTWPAAKYLNFVQNGQVLQPHKDMFEVYAIQRVPDKDSDKHAQKNCVATKSGISEKEVDCDAACVKENEVNIENNSHRKYIENKNCIATKSGISEKEVDCGAVCVQESEVNIGNNSHRKYIENKNCIATKSGISEKEVDCGAACVQESEVNIGNNNHRKYIEDINVAKTKHQKKSLNAESVDVEVASVASSVNKLDVAPRNRNKREVKCMEDMSVKRVETKKRKLVDEVKLTIKQQKMQKDATVAKENKVKQTPPHANRLIREKQNVASKSTGLDNSKVPCVCLGPKLSERDLNCLSVKLTPSATKRNENITNNNSNIEYHTKDSNVDATKEKTSKKETRSKNYMSGTLHTKEKEKDQFLHKESKIVNKIKSPVYSSGYSSQANRKMYWSQTQSRKTRSTNKEAQCYQRDKTLIQQEELQEEMKLKEIAKPVDSNLKQKTSANKKGLNGEATKRDSKGIKKRLKPKRQSLLQSVINFFKFN